MNSKFDTMDNGYAVSAINTELKDIITRHSNGMTKIKATENSYKKEFKLKIIDPINSIILSSIEAANKLLESSDESYKIISFDNMNFFNIESNSFCIQLFLSKKSEKINVLSDPYILIEINPELKEIIMYLSNRETGKHGEYKERIENVQTFGNKNFITAFISLLGAFLSANLSTTEQTAYASTG
jgi:hypothetical protein